MAQLEKILIGIREEDIRTKRTLNRRFLIIEGLYVNTGGTLLLSFPSVCVRACVPLIGCI